MQEIKKIVCDDVSGETLWEGILLPLKNGNYEGFIHSSVNITLINLNYVGCDATLTIKRNSLVKENTKSEDTYNLALVNSMGITEWFTTPEKNTVVCTKENVSNNLAKTYQKEMASNKQHIA